MHRLEEQLIKVDTASTPVRRANRYFFTRRTGDQNQASIYFRENGKEEVLVDPNSLSADHSTSVHILNVRVDGKVFAYGVRKGG